MLGGPPRRSALSENNGNASDTPPPEGAAERALPAEGTPDPPKAGEAPAAPAAPAASEQPAAVDGAAEAPKVETASERAEGPAVDVAALQRDVERLRAEIEESQARARTTQQRLTDEHERLLRTAAEFENYKKRAVKEKEDTRKFGIESLLKDFLPVADNLERALEAAAGVDPKQILDGVKLVHKLFEAALAKYGVSSFSALGQPFDPTLHEALMQADSDQP